MKLSESIPVLVDRFLEIEKMPADEQYDKRRGWNRAVTEHCKNRDSKESHLRASIKAQITKRGGNTSVLTW